MAELMIVENFNLQTIHGDLAEAIAEEMGGLGTIPFEQVKIPSGGGLAFEVPGEDADNLESATEIVGIILHHHPINAYWENKFEGGNEPPDCASMDGKQGINRETGEIFECGDCPQNEFGSDGGKGKACKNIHRLYILREGNPVPLILSLPPTSIKYIRNYIGKQILLKGLRCWQAVTKITLKKEKNSTGIAYSRAVFSFVGKLDPEQERDALQMRDIVKQQDKESALDADYELTDTFPQTPQKPEEQAGFINIPYGIEDEGLPFN